MTSEILCPVCHHSLGFHSYDFGECEAPIGGINMREKCGCGITIHILMDQLQKKDKTEELEALAHKYEIVFIKNENTSKLLTESIKESEFLLEKLQTVKTTLEDAKGVGLRSLGGALSLSYKKHIHELLDKAISEIEKENNNE